MHAQVHLSASNIGVTLSFQGLVCTWHRLYVDDLCAVGRQRAPQGDAEDGFDFSHRYNRTQTNGVRVIARPLLAGLKCLSLSILYHIHTDEFREPYDVCVKYVLLLFLRFCVVLLTFDVFPFGSS